MYPKSGACREEALHFNRFCSSYWDCGFAHLWYSCTEFWDPPSLYISCFWADFSPHAGLSFCVARAKTLSHHDTSVIDIAMEMIHMQGQNSSTSGVSGEPDSKLISFPEPWASPQKWSPKYQSGRERCFKWCNESGPIAPTPSRGESCSSC